MRKIAFFSVLLAFSTVAFAGHQFSLDDIIYSNEIWIVDVLDSRLEKTHELILQFNDGDEVQLTNSKSGNVSIIKCKRVNDELLIYGDDIDIPSYVLRISDDIIFFSPRAISMNYRNFRIQ